MASTAPELFRPLRRVEYDQLVALGTFQGERIELIAGALRRMSPVGPPHTSTVDVLSQLLVLALAGRAWVRVHGSYAADELSEPEPDFCILPLGTTTPRTPARRTSSSRCRTLRYASTVGRRQRCTRRAACPNTGSSIWSSASWKCIEILPPVATVRRRERRRARGCDCSRFRMWSSRWMISCADAGAARRLLRAEARQSRWVGLQSYPC